MKAIDGMFGICCTLFVEISYFDDRGWGYPLRKIGGNLGCQHLWAPQILNTDEIIVSKNYESFIIKWGMARINDCYIAKTLMAEIGLTEVKTFRFNIQNQH